MKLMLAMFALTVLFNIQVPCITSTVDVSTNTPGGIDGGPASSISNPSVSDAIVPGKTNTLTNNLTSTTAASVSSSTVGNSTTGERGSGGGADGVSFSYSVFVLTVIGANVMKVLEV